MSIEQLNTLEGQLHLSGAKIAILAARFNGFIVDSLVSGAVDVLTRSGIEHSEITLVKVPGAYEMPLAADLLLKSGQYDGVVALGAVIRGSTPHFDYVAGEAAKGLSGASMAASVPLAFGVLTVDSIEQAIERAGTKAGNKGGEAAQTLIEMISLVRQLRAS